MFVPSLLTHLFIHSFTPKRLIELLLMARLCKAEWSSRGLAAEHSAAGKGENCGRSCPCSGGLGCRCYLLPAASL